MTRRRQIRIVAAVVLALVAIVVTRAVWQGRNALSRGDSAIAEGRADDAITQYRRAARWYVPFAPHVKTAYDRLEQTARAAMGAGDQRVALSAWRGIRSSVLATRSFYTPFDDRLAEANEQIATLMAELEGPEADPKSDLAGRTAWHKALLDKPVGPSVAYSIVAIVGFIAWIGAAFWLAWAGFKPETDVLDKGVALRAGVLLGVGLVTWLIGLYLA